MNISNELLLLSSYPDYPAYLSERQGYVLFKRTIIIFGESNSSGILFLPETVKPLAFAIHLIANLRKQ